MLRLAAEVAAASGFVIVGVHQIADFLKITLPAIGLLGVLVNRFTPVPDYAMFWSTYALLVYHLISFHDHNTCLIEACHIDTIYAYILLGSTYVLWMSTGWKTKVAAPVKKDPPLRFTPIPAPKVKQAPVRLNMGDTVQSRWV